jgi:hypothetical protein
MKNNEIQWNHKDLCVSMDHNETTCCFSSTNTTTITTPYITDEVDNSQINRVYSPVTWFKELQITILS